MREQLVDPKCIRIERFILLHHFQTWIAYGLLTLHGVQGEMSESKGGL